MAINPFQQFNSPSMSLLNVGGFQDPLQPKPIGQDIVNVPQLQNQVGQLQARKNQQLGSMLLALGDIFRGQDPATGVIQRQQLFQEQEEERQARLEKQRVQTMEKNLQEALDAGDTDKALSLAVGLDKSALVQYLQAQRKSDQPYIIGGGRYTVTPTDGELDITVNQAVIDAEQRIAEQAKEDKSKVLPSTLIKSEDEDYTALEQHQNLQTDIDRFLTNIDEGKLEVGFGEDIQSFFGNLGLRSLDQESQEKLSNYNDLKRFVTRYVNNILRLNKGPQTEGDALRALDELKASKNPEDLKRVLSTLKNISNREINFRKTTINRRRESADVVSVDFDKPTWKIVE